MISVIILQLYFITIIFKICILFWNMNCQKSRLTESLRQVWKVAWKYCYSFRSELCLPEFPGPTIFCFRKGFIHLIMAFWNKNSSLFKKWWFYKMFQSYIKIKTQKGRKETIFKEICKIKTIPQLYRLKSVIILILKVWKVKKKTLSKCRLKNQTSLLRSQVVVT